MQPVASPKLLLAGILLLLAPLLPGVAVGTCGGGSGLLASGFEACDARVLSGTIALARDRVVTGPGSRTVLERELVLDAPARVFIVADGRHFPLGEEAAMLWVEIDGDAAVSSRSVTDWRESAAPVQHGFRVLAAATLPAGSHSIRLRAMAAPGDDGGIAVGGGSALHVFVGAASGLTFDVLPGPSPNIDVNTYRPAVGIDVNEGDPDRPFVPLATHVIDNSLPLAATAVSLVAGTAYNACSGLGDDGYGDALWGLWTDQQCPSTAAAAWSVNDLDPGAELEAPMYLHGATSLAPGGGAEIAWGVSELAFGSDQAGSASGSRENEVCYRVEHGAFLTATGSGVIGRSDPVLPTSFCATYTFRCVASTEGVVGCPDAGSWVVIGAADIEVPEDHDGLAYFSAITRVQGDNSDGFATARLRLRVDGRLVGTVGVQQLADGNGQASRTLSSSWLSAGVEALTPGLHRVEAVMAVDGERLMFVSAPRDVALTWFD